MIAKSSYLMSLMNLKVLVRQNENGCSVHTRGWILLESTKWTKSSLPKNLDRIHIAFLNHWCFEFREKQGIKYIAINCLNAFWRSLLDQCDIYV